MTRWFGVYDEENHEAKRVTFLIGKDGLIKKVWENIHGDNHSQDVLNELQSPNPNNE